MRILIHSSGKTAPLVFLVFLFFFFDLLFKSCSKADYWQDLFTIKLQVKMGWTCVAGTSGTCMQDISRWAHSCWCFQWSDVNYPWYLPSFLYIHSRYENGAFFLNFCDKTFFWLPLTSFGTVKYVSLGINPSMQLRLFCFFVSILVRRPAALQSYDFYEFWQRDRWLSTLVANNPKRL